MIKMKKLINRPLMCKGECLSSYLFRLSNANFYGGPFPLLTELQIDWSNYEVNRFDFESCVRVSEKCDISADKLYQASNLSFEASVGDSAKKMLLLRRNIKYCPSCIKDETYFKSLWFFNACTVCLDHRTNLVQNCENCGDLITLKNFLKGFCKTCKFEFDKAKGILVAPDCLLYLSQIEIQSILSGGRGVVFQGLSIKDIFEFFKANLNILEDLQSHVSDNKNCVITNQKKYYSNKNFGEVLANIFWMYSNFPSNFFIALDEFFELPFEKRRRRKKEFEKILEKEKCQFIKDAYKDFQNRQIQKGNVPKNIACFDIKTCNQVNRRYVTKKEIKEQFGLSRLEVDFLCENLPKKYSQKSSSFHRYKISVISKAVEELKHKKNAIVTKREAAYLLGTNVDNILPLVKEGILKEIPFMTRNFICKKSLKILQSLFEPNLKEEGNKYISLQRVFDKYATSGISLLSILHSLNQKKINSYANKGGAKLNELYFLEAEIEQLLIEKKEQLKYTVGLNLKEAATNLEMSENTVRILIDNQMLKAEEILKSSYHNKKVIIEEKEVAKFKEKYLTTKQAYKLYQKSPAYFRNLIYKRKLKNHLHGKCKKVLLLKDEVESFFQKIKPKG
ncbi:TniQ protein [Cytobacillus oceanisediminis]|uniref:TniQ protein n=2 Tax=Cytobacillus oceanisediminis TaxID=665099 RepID=A0A2V3A2B9_9BACI|nr:TniQ protein [Cytobacillus oceanisediminis]